MISCITLVICAQLVLLASHIFDMRLICRYMVLPQRPTGTEGWTEEQLQALVTRDSMIGVTFAKQPQNVTQHA